MLPFPFVPLRLLLSCSRRLLASGVELTCEIRLPKQGICSSLLKMATVTLHRTVTERIGHVAANCGKFVFMYGGYFAGPEGDEYHRADSISIYNTETELWQHARLTPMWPPQQQPGRPEHEHIFALPANEYDNPNYDGLGEEADVAARVQPVRSSGACGVHVPETDLLYVYGGHTAEGKAAALMCIDLRRLTCHRLLPDGPVSVDKLVGWHWQNRLYFFGGYGRRPAIGGGGDCLVDISSAYGFVWLNELISYDISCGAWRYERATGTPPSPRAAHAAVQLGTKVYIFGGRSGTTRLNDLHVLDLSTMCWSGRLTVKGEEHVVGRSWHSFTPVDNELILLYGGFSTEQVVLDDMWLLRVNELSWTRLDRGIGPCKQPSLWHSATHCPTSDSIVIFGGCSRNVLNQSTWADAGRHATNVRMISATKFKMSPDRLSRLCFKVVCSVGLQRATLGVRDADGAALLACLPPTIAQAFARLHQSQLLIAESEDNDGAFGSYDSASAFGDN